MERRGFHRNSFSGPSSPSIGRRYISSGFTNLRAYDVRRTPQPALSSKLKVIVILRNG